MRPESTPERTSALLERIAREDGHPDISLGELLDRFDGRAFGFAADKNRVPRAVGFDKGVTAGDER